MLLSRSGLGTCLRAEKHLVLVLKEKLSIGASRMILMVAFGKHEPSYLRPRVINFPAMSCGSRCYRTGLLFLGLSQALAEACSDTTGRFVCCLAFPLIIQSLFRSECSGFYCHPVFGICPLCSVSTRRFATCLSVFQAWNYD